MKQLLSLAALIFLSGCISNPFSSGPDVADNADGHAAKICHAAGEDSSACGHARVQAMTRCYRTIGVVNCYTSEDPFGTTGTARGIVQPIDGRPRTPSPG
jgi:hypothetical protein